ncbi:ribosome assembly cofactor RimP [Marinilabiliaceae bacterium ANBcel2]|nr:ribosome assembly cofactor RimP [Marinilabiliaceae bacterium ANBcel2]
MISSTKIEEIIAAKIESDGYYIVDVTVKPGNKIVVHVDSDSGVPVEYCVSLSRLIESSLDRDVEDFELEVSSPGIGYPFKVKQQYYKSIGKDVEVLTSTGLKITGELSSLSESSFVVKEKKKVKIEGKKRKELQIIEHTFNFSEVKAVKEVLKF